MMDRLNLSAAQRRMILELGSRRAGDPVDDVALWQLFLLKLVAVRPTRWRPVLTERGRAVYDILTRNWEAG